MPAFEPGISAIGAFGLPGLKRYTTGTPSKLIDLDSPMAFFKNIVVA